MVYPGEILSKRSLKQPSYGVVNSAFLRTMYSETVAEKLLKLLNKLGASFTRIFYAGGSI